MSSDLNTALRAALYQAYKGKTPEEIRNAIEVMCDPVEVVAVVKQKLKDEDAKRNKEDCPQ
ncbi:hypothetical protein FACS1894217_08560 [Clostridia bacterium]|nr:hypothetical protein FACS1894217_08560 [Clostridia bacterium]